MYKNNYFIIILLLLLLSVGVYDFSMTQCQPANLDLFRYLKLSEYNEYNSLLQYYFNDIDNAKYIKEYKKEILKLKRGEVTEWYPTEISVNTLIKHFSQYSNCNIESIKSLVSGVKSDETVTLHVYQVKGSTPDSAILNRKLIADSIFEAVKKLITVK